MFSPEEKTDGRRCQRFQKNIRNGFRTQCSWLTKTRRPFLTKKAGWKITNCPFLMNRSDLARSADNTFSQITTRIERKFRSPLAHSARGQLWPLISLNHFSYCEQNLLMHNILGDMRHQVSIELCYGISINIYTISAKYETIKRYPSLSLHFVCTLICTENLKTSTLKTDQLTLPLHLFTFHLRTSIVDQTTTKTVWNRRTITEKYCHFNLRAKRALNMFLVRLMKCSL